MGFFERRKARKEQEESERLEWIRSTLDEIEEKLNPENKSGIRYSISVGGGGSSIKKEKTLFDHWSSSVEEPAFQEMLMTCLRMGHYASENTDFYKRAHIDRKLFSYIAKNRDYHPSKETAVACCIGLRLPLDDAEKLLACAGYKLSMSIKWDRIVYYLLKQGYSDMNVFNDFLYEAGEKLIRV